MVMSVCFMFRKGQDPAHELAETIFSSDFPKCIHQMFLLLISYLYSSTTPACLFPVVGEVYGVMACFPQPVCFTLPYAINCRWIWHVLIK